MKRDKEAVKRLVEALHESLPDLKHYVALHGPGPDRRLAALIDALQAVEEIIE